MNETQFSAIVARLDTLLSSRDEDALLVALAVITFSEPVTVAEIFAHAKVNRALAAILSQGDAVTPHSIGKWLAKCAETPRGLCRVEKLRIEDGRKVWRITAMERGRTSAVPAAADLSDDPSVNIL